MNQFTHRVVMALATFALAIATGSVETGLITGAAEAISSSSVLIEQQAAGVRFSVQDESTVALRLEVLGLDGRRIFQSEWQPDKTVVWSAALITRHTVANGVYLYAISVRDRKGREQRKLGKLVLVQGLEPRLSIPAVSELVATEPAAARFPLTPGTSWSQRLGIDRSDTYRIQRRPPRVAGGPPTTFENLLQLQADGKLRIKELCLGTVFAPFTAQNPDNLSNEGDCRSSWSGVTGGGTSNGWTDDGAIVRLANATDKVGIGTTNPTELLTVAGNIDATGQKSKIRFQFDTLADLPSATTYHGMFAHVHATGKAYFAHAGQWVALANEGSGGGSFTGWSLTGNTGINASTNFLGTTDTMALVFRTNNLERMRITGDGNVGIGTTNPCVNTQLRVVESSSGLDCTPFVAAAIFAESDDFAGVIGRSDCCVGVFGDSGDGTGVLGRSKSGLYLFLGVDNGDNNNTRFAVERATGKVLADGAFTGPADFAEMMEVSGTKEQYEPGDVLVIGLDGKLIKASSAYATNLAGVYSTKPGFLGDTEVAAHGIESLEKPSTTQRVPVAVVGIVPVKVGAENGSIHPGDLLTTSTTPGRAMKAKPVMISGVAFYPMGTILGKALESLEKGTGVIQVLVTLR